MFHCFLLALLLCITEGTTAKVCTKANWYLEKPMKQLGLYGNCGPFRQLSCCSNETAYEWHKQKPFGIFDTAHCGSLSDSCRKHFAKQSCFKYCSPNLGPWIVKDDIGNFGAEKPFGMPLCARDCKRWWNACKNDLTCAQDWTTELDYTSGGPLCRAGTTCRPFTEVYGNHKTFCETVLKGDFIVTDDDEPCMKFSFSSKNNPNERVSEFYRNMQKNHATIN